MRRWTASTSEVPTRTCSSPTTVTVPAWTLSLLVQRAPEEAPAETVSGSHAVVVSQRQSVMSSRPTKRWISFHARRQLEPERAARAEKVAETANLFESRRTNTFQVRYERDRTHSRWQRRLDTRDLVSPVPSQALGGKMLVERYL